MEPHLLSGIRGQPVNVGGGGDMSPQAPLSAANPFPRLSTLFLEAKSSLLWSSSLSVHHRPATPPYTTTTTLPPWIFQFTDLPADTNACNRSSNSTALVSLGRFRGSSAMFLSLARAVTFIFKRRVLG